MNFRVAAKAFIVNDGKLFMMKRRANDPHKPGAWDIPGGRLELGEDPYQGLMREVREETGCEVEIVMPLDVQHFTRDDEQRITLIIFLTKFTSGEPRLSEEHQEFKWLELKSDNQEIPKFFDRVVKNYLKHIK